METLSPISATWITLALMGVLLLIPIVEKIPVLGKVVSLRWAVVCVSMVLSVAVIVDFSHLSDDIRHTVLIGGFIISGAFMVFRSVEKWLYNGWIFKTGRVEARLGDKATVSVDGVQIGACQNCKAQKENIGGDVADNASHDASDDLKRLADYEAKQ